MRESDDIENLFEKFKGLSAHYQDIFMRESAQSSAGRWPLLAWFDAVESAGVDVPAASETLATPTPIRPVALVAPAAVSPATQSLAVQARQDDFVAPVSRSVLASQHLRQVVKQVRRPMQAAGSVAAAKVRFERLPEGLAPLVVAVVGAKGGVGRTSVVANLSTALAHGGLSVLALDLDPKNSLHPHFGFDPADMSGVARAALAQQPWADCIRPCVPGPAVAEGNYVLKVLSHGLLDDTDYQRFEQQITADPFWLQRHLHQLNLPSSTVVLIDLPTHPSPVVRQALQIAHFVVGVTLADPASYLCMPQMERLIRTHCAPRADFLGHGYLINQVDHSSKLGQDIARLLRQQHASHVLGLIHRDQSVPEALACDTNVLDYDAEALASHDFFAFAGRLCKMLAAQPLRSAVDETARRNAA